MENIRNFISTITAAISNCSLYSKDHPSVDEFVGKSAKALDVLLGDTEKLEIMHLNNKFIINEIPFITFGLQDVKLINRLRRKGISYVKFLPGITVEELKQFVIEMVTVDGKLAASAHIKTGVLDIQVVEEKADVDFDSENISSFVSAQVGMAKDIYHDISQAKNPNIAMLYEIMKNFVAASRKRTNIIKLLGHAKTREEYTYIHATNVSALSIFQLECLGLKEKSILYDVGIAGLLHDVGKLFLRGASLEKRGALDEKEWEEMKLHPLHGAKYLASIEDLPQLAIVVAFQHHLRQDGHGYPPLRMSDEGQHVCSQIVSISDVFDALRSTRPYKKGLEIKEVLQIMKKDSGRAFNPVFLSNFIRRLNEALSE